MALESPFALNAREITIFRCKSLQGLHLPQTGYSPMRLQVRLTGPYLLVNKAMTSVGRNPAMISTLIAAIARARANARAIATLSRLDDSRLRDIGIARDQIELFVAGKI
jgi:uncharacterized protein YjiS (DUF1127 family)